MLLKLTEIWMIVRKWGGTAFAFCCPREVIFENILVRNTLTSKSNYKTVCSIQRVNNFHSRN